MASGRRPTWLGLLATAGSIVACYGMPGASSGAGGTAEPAATASAFTWDGTYALTAILGTNPGGMTMMRMYQLVVRTNGTASLEVNGYQADVVVACTTEVDAVGITIIVAQETEPDRFPRFERGEVLLRLEWSEDGKLVTRWRAAGDDGGCEDGTVCLTPKNTKNPPSIDGKSRDESYRKRLSATEERIEKASDDAGGKASPAFKKALAAARTAVAAARKASTPEIANRVAAAERAADDAVRIAGQEAAKKTAAGDAATAASDAWVSTKTACAADTTNCETKCKEAPGSDDCVALIDLLIAGGGTPAVSKNIARGVGMARKGCTLGNKRACTVLKRFEAVAAKCDDAEACKAHCGFDLAAGCEQLAAIHINGDGVPVNQAAAHPFLVKACDLGSGSACTKLGTAYVKGWGTPKDLKKAQVALQRACDLNDAVGCSLLERFCLETGKC